MQPRIDDILSGHKPNEQVTDTPSPPSLDLLMEDESLVEHCFTTLHLTVLQLQSWDLEMLLESYHMDIDMPDVNGQTALLWAAWRGDAECVRLLSMSRYGANLNATDMEEWTPLAKACKAGHLGVCQFLLNVSASPSIPNLDGLQPIHHASGNRSTGVAIIQHLLQHGADVNARTKSRQTPLRIAARHGNLDVVISLLAYGADRDLVDANGDTPLILVSRLNKSASLSLRRLAQLETLEDFERVAAIQRALDPGNGRVE
jgi:ankyrin repeat protein